jgi:hypothetical protein
MLWAALLPCLAGAESFQLADGSELEADIVRFTAGLIGIALLLSSVGLIFILRHWRQAMGPLILNLIGIALVVIAACLEVIWTAV